MSDVEKKIILVVGDWLVDEDWVTGIHRSMTSSRTGQAHFRGLNPMHTQESFCGAGKTAAILYNAKRMLNDTLNNSALFNIIGIGAWHVEDTADLSLMIAEQGGTEHRPDKLNRSLCLENCNIKDCLEDCQIKNCLKDCNINQIPKDIQLINLADAFFDNQGSIKESDEKNKELFGTTRVIRIYQKTREKTELIQRIDWETQPRLASKYWKNKKKADFIKKRLEKKLIDAVKMLLNANPERENCDITWAAAKIDAIVIKDMLKGVITVELVKWLTKRFSSSNWYLSSKKWRPKWYTEIFNGKKPAIKVVIVPGAAVSEVVRSGKKNLTKWINHKGHATREALDLLKELKDDLSHLKKNLSPLIAVLPKKHTVLALVSNNKDNGSSDILIQSKTYITQKQPVIETPFASIFFSAIIALDLQNKYTEKEILKYALSYSVKYQIEHYKRIERQYRKFSLRDPVLFLENSSMQEWGKEYYPKWVDNEFDILREEWTKSKQSLGFLSNNNDDNVIDFNVHGTLQLWRAMTEIDGYVCLETPKRKKLQKLVQYLNAFKYSNPKRSQSIMLYASPGSGKSYLVKCLANALEFNLISFNATQLFAKTDLLDCFDSIATLQAQKPNDKFLVFVDEINAEIQNQNIYDAFLAPLEDGYYIRAEKIFHIMPCIWIFAGTNNPIKQSISETGNTVARHAQKLSDFQSRLTYNCNLRVGTNEVDPHKLENDVNGVDKELLKGAAQQLITSVKKQQKNVLAKTAKGEISRFQDYVDPVSYHSFLKLFEKRLKVDELDDSAQYNLSLIRNYSNDDRSLKELKLEGIYSGIFFLRKEFPDVIYVSDRVLAMFKRFPLTKSKRELGHFIRLFKNIQYSIVVWDNVPKNVLHEYFKKETIEDLFSKWSKKSAKIENSEYLIKIED